MGVLYGKKRDKVNMNYRYLQAVREIFLTEILSRVNNKVIGGIRTCTIEITTDSLYMGTCLYRTTKLCTAFRNVFAFVDVEKESAESTESAESAVYFYELQSPTTPKRKINLYGNMY